MTTRRFHRHRRTYQGWGFLKSSGSAYQFDTLGESARVPVGCDRLSQVSEARNEVSECDFVSGSRSASVRACCNCCGNARRTFDGALFTLSKKPSRSSALCKECPRESTMRANIGNAKRSDRGRDAASFARATSLGSRNTVGSTMSADAAPETNETSQNGSSAPALTIEPDRDRWLGAIDGESCSGVNEALGTGGLASTWAPAECQRCRF